MCHGRTVLVLTCSNSTERKVQLFSITVICTLKRASSRTEEKAEYIAHRPDPPPSAMQQWVNSILRDEPMHITDSGRSQPSPN